MKWKILKELPKGFKQEVQDYKPLDDAMVKLEMGKYLEIAPSDNQNAGALHLVIKHRIAKQLSNAGPFISKVYRGRVYVWKSN